MASGLYIFDGSSSSSSSSSMFRNSSSPDEMFSSETTTTDLFCNNNELYSVDETLSIYEHFSPHILSSSPPCDLLGTLTLSHPIPTTAFYPDYSDYQISDAVKSENFFGGHNQTETARSYGAIESAGRYMQRSLSSHFVEGKPKQLPFEPSSITMSSSENAFFTGQMRRGYSTGDLQKLLRKDLAEQRSSEPFGEEQNVKVRRYSAEERKEKISKYRAKRNQRNFTKTIKYACRKTLADSRPRIRGRFARNDEIVEIPNTIEDDHPDLWKLDDENEAFVSSFVVQHSSYW